MLPHNSNFYWMAALVWRNLSREAFNMRKKLILSTVICVVVMFAAAPAYAQTTQTPATPPTTAAPTAPTVTPPKPDEPVIPVPPAPATGGDAIAPAPDANSDPSAADSEGGAEDGLSVGEIPAVETEELTAEMARKALDGYLMVHEKYKDSPLENYDDLQAFVDKDPKGKDFENDVKLFGFKDVNDWNLAITTLSFAYTNVLDDQTGDIKQQIEEIKADTEMAQDMKDRMTKSLQAMIPSDNNRKIVEDLIKDPVYGDKIKLLETTAE
jgi:hypothetical protein